MPERRDAEPFPCDAGADEAVAAFWRHYRRFGVPPRGPVERVAGAALDRDPKRAARGARLLFAGLVEPLCDAFTPSDAATYDRVFAQVLSLARADPQCRALDRALADAGIGDEDALVARAAAAGVPARVGAADRARVRRVFVLSRLTLGADVAVTSMVLRRARERFANADLRLVGPPGARLLADGVDGAGLIEVEYGRFDGLAGRLNAWPALRRRLGAAQVGLEPDEVVYLDTDSRLTQLGLLPPPGGAWSLRFPSRGYAAADASPLSALAGRWLAEVLGGPGPPLPSLSLTAREAQRAGALRARLGGGRTPIVCVSFGAGGNARKRAGLRFETDLVRFVVRQGCRVALARGVGESEVAEAYWLAARLEAAGVGVRHLARGAGLAGINGTRLPAVVTWEGGVADFVAAIAAADCYVGYDSAGQHIAAALGVPTLSVFVESARRRHAERWRPRGPGAVRVVRSRYPADATALLACARAAFVDLA